MSYSSKKPSLIAVTCTARSLKVQEDDTELALSTDAKEVQELKSDEQLYENTVFISQSLH